MGAFTYLAWVLLLALFFAMVEVHIEGDAGWAARLPTWRIEQHPLLDIFWGGRPMTGYHAWVFSFMALIFHLPLFFAGQVSWPLEARVLGGLMWFWIAEDFLWFLCNPHYGLRRFNAAGAAWHRRWLAGLPVDYWQFGVIGSLLLWYSYRSGGR